MTGKESRGNQGPLHPTDDPNGILIYLLPFGPLSMHTYQQKWENIVRTPNGLICYHLAMLHVGKRAPVAQSNKRLLCTNDEQGEFEQRTVSENWSTRYLDLPFAVSFFCTLWLF